MSGQMELYLKQAQQAREEVTTLRTTLVEELREIPIEKPDPAGSDDRESGREELEAMRQTMEDMAEGNRNKYSWIN